MYLQSISTKFILQNGNSVSVHERVNNTDRSKNQLESAQ